MTKFFWEDGVLFGNWCDIKYRVNSKTCMPEIIWNLPNAPKYDKNFDNDFSRDYRHVTIVCDGKLVFIPELVKKTTTVEELEYYVTLYGQYSNNLNYTNPDNGAKFVYHFGGFTLKSQLGDCLFGNNLFFEIVSNDVTREELAEENKDKKFSSPSGSTFGTLLNPIPQVMQPRVPITNEYIDDDEYYNYCDDYDNYYDCVFSDEVQFSYQHEIDEYLDEPNYTQEIWLV